jgi:hypothetical protein
MKKEEAISYLQQLYQNGGHCWLDEQRIEAIDMAIKALQEEPASKDKFTFTSLPRLLDRIKPTDRAKWYSSRLADALEEEGYITDAKIVRESIKIMNGEKVPMATMDEEPVSEDLEEASKEWLRPQLDKSYANYGEAKMMELTHFDGYAMLDAIEFGAKWQKAKDESTTEDLGEYISELSKQFPEVSFAKLSRIAVRVAKWQEEQFEKKRLKHCDELTKEQAQIESNFVTQHLKKNNRTPTFIDAIEYGMRLRQEQMINDAYEREVKVDAGGYPYIPQMELYDYDKDVPLAKEGDKYKVVLIKKE